MIEALWRALEVVDISLPPSLAPRDDAEQDGDSTEASRAGVVDGCALGLKQGHTGGIDVAESDMHKGKLQGLKFTAVQVVKVMGGTGGGRTKSHEWVAPVSTMLYSLRALLDVLPFLQCFFQKLAQTRRSRTVPRGGASRDPRGDVGGPSKHRAGWECGK